jgi:hypothetical protein
MIQKGEINSASLIGLTWDWGEPYRCLVPENPFHIVGLCLKLYEKAACCLLYIGEFEVLTAVGRCQVQRLCFDSLLLLQTKVYLCWEEKMDSHEAGKSEVHPPLYLFGAGTSVMLCIMVNELIV